MLLYFKVLADFILNFAFIFIFFAYLIQDSLPSIEAVNTMKRSAYIKILDKNGNLIGKYGHLQESIILAQDLPTCMKQAIIDIEDKNFYQHKGISILSILRSLFYNVSSNKIITGGSTITQQLAKNILQNEEQVTMFDKTLIRKIKEIFLAKKIEKKYSKNEILTLYLNRIYFGSACYGIYSGAITHFNKAPSSLNLYESAALAGLIQAPSRFVGNKEFWKKRTKTVLKAMLRNKHITKEQYEEFENFQFEMKSNMVNYGYFADWVITQVPAHLKYRDLIIKTTIDSFIQEKAMLAIEKTYSEYGQKWNAEQGAMVVLDKNGATRALVGGLNFKESQFNRAINANRSVGSFFKYYIYLEAIKRGLNPESVINDEAISIGAWNPSNYLHKSAGKIKVKDAYAQSVNSTGVLLLLTCGTSNVIKLAQNLGINKKIEANPSIALGGFNASLMKITNTMIPIINNGYKTQPYCIEEIYDASNDKLLYKHKTQFEQVLDARTIFYMWNLMKHVSKGTARSLSTLKDKIVGGKTGTSNDYRDLTFIGATPDYVFGAWFGRDDYSPMQYVPGTHLGVIACRYFLEQMPPTQEDLNIDTEFEYNTLSFEDLLLQ